MAVTSALLEAAYTNVSLLADAAWAPCSMGPMGVPLSGTTVNHSTSIGATGTRTGVEFRRANRDLWLRCINLDRYIRENGGVTMNNNGHSCHSSASSTPTNSGLNNRCFQYKVGAEDKPRETRPRTVRDTIPLSRLASYSGQVAYDEEREQLYTADDCYSAGSPVLPQDAKLADEPWLMSAVEEIFKRLTALPLRPSKPQNKIDEYTDASFQGMSRLWNVEPEFPGQLKFSSSAASRDGKPLTPPQLQHSKSEPQLSSAQRYTLTNHDEFRLQMRIRAQAVQDLWTKMNTGTQVRLADPPLQPPLQKVRQINHHSHHHGNSHKQMSSGGRLTRHRSLSRFPALQIQNLVVPQLNVDVPEFYPKMNGPPYGRIMGVGSNCPTGIGDGGLRNNNVANGVTVFFPPANELAYQEELFPYRTEHDPRHNRKLHMDHTAAGVLVRPPGNGTIPEPLTRSNHQWLLQSSANSNGKSTSLHCTPPPSAVLPTPPLPVLPPPLALSHPHKSLKAARHSARNGKMQSIPIPVYQRPPEFYTQQNESATNGNGTAGSIGARRRTGGSGVDFSNLILLTRGGKSHNRPCASSSPSTQSVSSKAESFASDLKPEANRSSTTEEHSRSPASSQPPSAPQIPSSQSNQSPEDVFQWLHAAFGSTKTKNRHQVGSTTRIENEISRRYLHGDTRTPQSGRASVFNSLGGLDIAEACPSEAGAENDPDDATGGTRRRLYRDVLTRASCSVAGEETPPSRPVSPTAPEKDKFELLEEEALMQYQSSDDSLAERMQSQSQRRMDSATATPSTGTTQSTTKQRRFQDQCERKPPAATPPPPPPAPPKDEVQSPRRRLYRDVLAHRRAELTVETTRGGPPSESTSWCDILQKLEEQALVEYRMSDDATSATGEVSSNNTSEEALTRRYQDLERQAIMQYLRGTPSNSEIRANYDEDSPSQRTLRGRGSNDELPSQRIDEDTMIDLKLLQRDKTRVSLPKSQPNRLFSLRDNQTDKRVYRKQVLKKPVQLQPNQQLLHLQDSPHKFIQMPRLPQQIQMLNNADVTQTAQQQLLQELLHFNQQTIPTFEQLSPFQQQKIPKLPQPEFCLQQQNYQLCQQPPQPTFPQPFSQLQLIELQQRLSHPGLSPQQIVELQTLYQHQTDILQQKASKKQYLQKTIAPKHHSREHSQQKIHLENQEIQRLEIQRLELQQRMANVPLVLPVSPIVAPQTQLMEMQSRWMNSQSCPLRPVPQCGPILDPHGDMALGGHPSPRQLPTSSRLQDRQLNAIPSIQVTDSAASHFTSNPILAAEESSQKSDNELSTLLNTDIEVATSQDSSPQKSEEPHKERSEQKLAKKSTKKINAKNNCKKGQKKAKNSTGNRAKSQTGKKGEKTRTVSKEKYGKSFKNNECKEHRMEESKKSSQLTSLSSRNENPQIIPTLKSSGSHTIRIDRKKARSNETNNEVKRRRTDNES